MKVKIRIQKPMYPPKLPGEITQRIEWVDLGGKSASGPPVYSRCEWLMTFSNRNTSDVIKSDSVMMLDTVTIKIWYKEGLNEKCRILLVSGKDEIPYEILSIEDVRAKRHCMYVKIQRYKVGK